MNGLKSYIHDLRKGHGVRLLMLILGGLFIVYPGTAQKTLGTVIAIAFVLMGVFKILSYFKKPQEDAFGYMEYKSKSVIIIGILYIVLAALISKVLLAVIPVLLGIIIVVNGLVKLQFGLEIKKNYDDRSWLFMVISACIMLILGATLLFNPFRANNFFIRLIGIGLVFDSLFDLIANFKYSR
ncbi:MAG: DUF308 domain-containing protein [Clostridium sp.]|nr:DUF308 domain-containing protein [Clostridium sp.]MCM1398286.1 DUF308 domain-containing protein [Clostridium sp.]MCM1459050.1 DUF308 domain-containing protein [Bacteroides sp.]